MMRIFGLVLACGLAEAAGARCLAPGQMPDTVTFADGEVMDHISREGDHLKSVTHLDHGFTATSDDIFGLYPAYHDVEGYSVVYHWKRKHLPALADLQPGKAVTLRGREEMPGGSLGWSMTVTLIAAEDVAVGGCSYPALHLAVQTKDTAGVRSEGETWLDPDRWLVWAASRKLYDSQGKLEKATGLRAVAAQ